MRKIVKTCRQCKIEFSSRLKNQVFCSHDCSKTWQAERYRLENLTVKFGVNKGAVGTISEYRVCVDLLIKGYHVYRAMSPHSPCDVIAYADGTPVFKIEVKTAYERNGRLYYPKSNPDLSDAVAAVTFDRIVYIPELPDPKGGKT